MHLIPSWAPNVHPLVIHFPIVLVLLALLVDGIELVHPLPGLAKAGTAVYALAAISAVVAVLTGVDASGEVFVPGMAHPMVENHEHWALTTMFALIGVAMARGVMQALGTKPASRRRRIVFFALSVGLAVLVEQTAERGARLVYQEGIGVEAGPGPAQTVAPGDGSATTPQS